MTCENHDFWRKLCDRLFLDFFHHVAMKFETVENGSVLLIKILVLHENDAIFVS